MQSHWNCMPHSFFHGSYWQQQQQQHFNISTFPLCPNSTLPNKDIYNSLHSIPNLNLALLGSASMFILFHLNAATSSWTTPNPWFKLCPYGVQYKMWNRHLLKNMCLIVINQYKASEYLVYLLVNMILEIMVQLQVLYILFTKIYPSQVPTVGQTKVTTFNVLWLVFNRTLSIYNHLSNLYKVLCI